MGHLARLYGLYCPAQPFGQRPVVFLVIASCVDNDDTEGKFLEVLLELEAAVECKQDLEVSLRQLYKLAVGDALPVRLAYRSDLVSGQKVADAGIKAFV